MRKIPGIILSFFGRSILNSSDQSIHVQPCTLSHRSLWSFRFCRYLTTFLSLLFKYILSILLIGINTLRCYMIIVAWHILPQPHRMHPLAWLSQHVGPVPVPVSNAVHVYKNSRSVLITVALNQFHNLHLCVTSIYEPLFSSNNDQNQNQCLQSARITLLLCYIYICSVVCCRCCLSVFVFLPFLRVFVVDHIYTLVLICSLSLVNWTL